MRELPGFGFTVTITEFESVFLIPEVSVILSTWNVYVPADIGVKGILERSPDELFNVICSILLSGLIIRYVKLRSGSPILVTTIKVL